MQPKFEFVSGDRQAWAEDVQVLLRDQPRLQLAVLTQGHFEVAQAGQQQLPKRLLILPQVLVGPPALDEVG